MVAHQLPPFCNGNWGSSRDPPPDLREVRLRGGAARSGAWSETVMSPSLRWAFIFPPGAHCAGSSSEMSCPQSGHLPTIAPQSSEWLSRVNEIL